LTKACETQFLCRPDLAEVGLLLWLCYFALELIGTTPDLAEVELLLPDLAEVGLLLWVCYIALELKGTTPDLAEVGLLLWLCYFALELKGTHVQASFQRASWAPKHLASSSLGRPDLAEVELLLCVCYIALELKGTARPDLAEVGLLLWVCYFALELKGTQRLIPLTAYREHLFQRPVKRSFFAGLTCVLHSALTAYREHLFQRPEKRRVFAGMIWLKQNFCSGPDLAEVGAALGVLLFPRAERHNVQASFQRARPDLDYSLPGTSLPKACETQFLCRPDLAESRPRAERHNVQASFQRASWAPQVLLPALWEAKKQLALHSLIWLKPDLAEVGLLLWVCYFALQRKGTTPDLAEVGLLLWVCYFALELILCRPDLAEVELLLWVCYIALELNGKTCSLLSIGRAGPQSILLPALWEA
uniref:Transmembrane protein n=1 Tax=Parascaris equorum TaxID=6256 RepID=A0A914S6L1_PAREQ